MINFFCSIPEFRLVEDIQEIGYGEIYDVQRETGAPYGSIQVDEKMAEMLRLLRAGAQFDRVVIHDGLPTLGEFLGICESGRRYTKKTKF